jgi:hypothetical protein
LGDPIDIQNHIKLNIESINGKSRLFEDSDVDVVYVHSLESKKSEYDLNYEYNDEESDNDNTITENEDAKGEIIDDEINIVFNELYVLINSLPRSESVDVSICSTIYDSLFDTLQRRERENDDYYNNYNYKSIYRSLMLKGRLDWEY